MLPLNTFIEGRNLEILPEWKAKVEEELTRLQNRYNDPIVNARVEIIGTGHHKQGQFEIRIVATVPGNVLTVTRQGELVHPLMIEGFDVLDRRCRKLPMPSSRKSKITRKLRSAAKFCGFLLMRTSALLKPATAARCIFMPTP